jgi:hypothetical protein
MLTNKRVINATAWLEAKAQQELPSQAYAMNMEHVDTPVDHGRTDEGHQGSALSRPRVSSQYYGHGESETSGDRQTFVLFHTERHRLPTSSITSSRKGKSADIMKHVAFCPPAGTDPQDG